MLQPNGQNLIKEYVSCLNIFDWLSKKPHSLHHGKNWNKSVLYHALLNSPVGFLYSCSACFSGLKPMTTCRDNGILKGLWIGPVRHETLCGGLIVCLSQFQPLCGFWNLLWQPLTFHCLSLQCFDAIYVCKCCCHQWE